jgi:hypothetical protein
VLASFVYTGDEEAAIGLKSYALMQLDTLHEAMSFQGLQQDSRFVRLQDGSEIMLQSVFGQDFVSIYVPPVIEAVGEEEVGITQLQLYLDVDMNAYMAANNITLVPTDEDTPLCEPVGDIAENDGELRYIKIYKYHQHIVGYDHEQDLLEAVITFNAKGIWEVEITDNYAGLVWLVYNCYAGIETQYPGRITLDRTDEWETSNKWQDKDVITLSKNSFFIDILPYLPDFVMRVKIDEHELLQGGQLFGLRYTNFEGDICEVGLGFTIRYSKRASYPDANPGIVKVSLRDVDLNKPWFLKLSRIVSKRKAGDYDHYDWNLVKECGPYSVLCGNVDGHPYDRLAEWRTSTQYENMKAMFMYLVEYDQDYYEQIGGSVYYRCGKYNGPTAKQWDGLCAPEFEYLLKEHPIAPEPTYGELPLEVYHTSTKNRYISVDGIYHQLDYFANFLGTFYKSAERYFYMDGFVEKVSSLDERWRSDQDLIFGLFSPKITINHIPSDFSGAIEEHIRYTHKTPIWTSHASGTPYVIDEPRYDNSWWYMSRIWMVEQLTFGESETYNVNIGCQREGMDEPHITTHSCTDTSFSYSWEQWSWWPGWPYTPYKTDWGTNTWTWPEIEGKTFPVIQLSLTADDQLLPLTPLQITSINLDFDAIYMTDSHHIRQGWMYVNDVWTYVENPTDFPISYTRTIKKTLRYVPTPDIFF